MIAGAPAIIAPRWASHGPAPTSRRSGASASRRTALRTLVRVTPIRPALAALALAACSSSSAAPPDSGVDLGGTLPPVDGAEDASPGDVAVTVDGGVADAGLTLPAFPGAQGWAAHTPGGRGGQIIRVTTLSPGGTGSLAAALATQGPRIIVFEVGGVIDMMGARYMVTMPYVTIAGQTAPSPGITLIRGGIIIRTHDVILQHIRVRPGEAGRAKMSGWEVDSIATDTGAYNVIVDHCSTTWGTDENLSASGERFQGATPDDWRNATSHIVTFSNNIVAEGLSNSTHSDNASEAGRSADAIAGSTFNVQCFARSRSRFRN